MTQLERISREAMQRWGPLVLEGHPAQAGKFGAPAWRVRFQRTWHYHDGALTREFSALGETAQDAVERLFKLAQKVKVYDVGCILCR